MFNIRPLTEQDAYEYRNIRLEALKNAPEAFATSYEEEEHVPVEMVELRLKAEGAITFGLFHFEELVAVGTLLFEQKQKLSHRATFVAMYVNPEHQGKGMGRELLTYAIKHARSKEEIDQIYLTVVSTNNRAKELYESLGFKCYGVDKRALKLANGMYFDEALMVLELKGIIDEKVPSNEV